MAGFTPSLKSSNLQVNFFYKIYETICTHSIECHQSYYKQVFWKNTLGDLDHLLIYLM